MTHAAVIASREAQLVGQVLHDAIRVDRAGAVVTLTIDHPPANAVNGDVINGLAEGLSTQDFTDLIAYLETLKDVKPAAK